MESLTAEEREAVEQVHERISGVGEKPVATVYDAYRFARARGFDVDKAVAMYGAMVEWAESFGPGDLDYRVRPELRQALERDVVRFVGRARSGAPSFILYPGNHYAKNTPLDLYIDSTVAVASHVMDNMLDPARGIEEVNVIADYSGFAYANIDTPALRAFMKLQDYYPERLGHAFVLNAPWVFKVIWKVASTLMDDRTKSKITFASGPDVADVLAAHYEPAALPAEFGGSGAFPFFSEDIDACLSPSPRPSAATSSDAKPPTAKPPTATDATKVAAEDAAAQELPIPESAPLQIHLVHEVNERTARVVAAGDTLHAATVDDGWTEEIWGEARDAVGELCARAAAAVAEAPELAAAGPVGSLMAYRFLVARKFDLEAATKMLLSALRWRVSRGVSSLSVDSPGVSAALATGKAYFHYYDMAMRPIIVVNMAKHTKSADCTPTLDLVLLMIETALAYAPPPHREFVVIADFRDSGLANYELDLFKRALGVLMSRYPECMHALYIVQAPWVFSGVWRVLKGLLDARTRAKVIFLSSAFEDTLLSVIHPSCLPHSLGGSSSYLHDPAAAPRFLGPLFPLPLDVVDAAITPAIAQALHDPVDDPAFVDSDDDDDDGYFTAGDDTDDAHSDPDDTA